MTERKALLALLLLAAAVAVYIWGRDSGAPARDEPAKVEATERVTADPFPAPPAKPAPE